MENNGRGIFYGVIGVATLVVAIIGATFAYFTATANSANDAVTTGGATVTLTYSEVKTGLKSNLIPVDVSTAAFNKVVGTATTNCKDTNGNNVCSVYQFTIGNDANNAAQRIYASLKTQTNSFTTSNLKFAIFKGTADKVAASTQVVGGTGKAGSTAADGDLVVPATTLSGTDPIDLTNLNEVLPGGQSRTYTVVLWINETKAEQNADQGKNFSGGVFFTTVGGESNTGITGVLSA